MAAKFSNFLKWVLIGGGTVLSLIPGIGPLVGAGILTAGLSVKTDSGTSADVVSVYGANLNTAIETSNAMMTGANVNTFLNNIITFIQKNFVVILVAVGALVVLPKLLKRRR
jgi:hypothetical protein